MISKSHFHQKIFVMNYLREGGMGEEKENVVPPKKFKKVICYFMQAKYTLEKYTFKECTVKKYTFKTLSCRQRSFKNYLLLYAGKIHFRKNTLLMNAL